MEVAVCGVSRPRFRRCVKETGAKESVPCQAGTAPPAHSITPQAARPQASAGGPRHPGRAGKRPGPQTEAGGRATGLREFSSGSSSCRPAPGVRSCTGLLSPSQACLPLSLKRSVS